MPKILIKEVDNTAAVGATITDIAYVPGLMGLSDSNTEFNGTYNEPVLCTTVSEFENYFGVKPQILNSTVTADAEEAVTYNSQTMMVISNKTVDRSYVYAKELISAGMPVVYEAIKRDVENQIQATMGACTYTAPKTGTPTWAAKIDSTVIDNGDNTIKLDRATGNKDLFIKLVTNKTTKYVTVYMGPETTIKNIYNMSTDDTLGTALQNPSPSFVTSNTDDAYLIHLSFQSSAQITNAEYIKVMVSTTEYAEFVPYTVSAPTKYGYLYSVLADRFDRLQDKSVYDIKYITSGGYPTFASNENTLAKKMMSVAASRGDCVALVDHVDQSARMLVGPGSLYDEAIKNETFTDGTFGAMFTPYGQYTCNTLSGEQASQVMPASFGYLMCLAKAVQTSPNWLAMAGVTRGVVPGLDHLTCSRNLSNVVADEYQPRSNGTSINAITNIKPYGLTVWGNRTLARAGDELKAVNFLNTRNMISDIKKQAYATARACMFEQDSDTLWLKFKAGVTPLLDGLKSGYGISNYKLIKSNKGVNGETLGKGQVGVIIKIYPIYAVEYFEICVVIADDVQVS